MTDPGIIAPADISFEGAIALTQQLMDQMEQGTVEAPALEQAIACLVCTSNGARGFFVSYLSDERAIADRPTPAVLKALTASPETVSELLVKNLAMSSAMAIAHRRNQREDLATGSDRVKTRTTQLIKILNLPQIQERGSQLWQSAATGKGDYAAFLNRWGYDAEQRLVIQSALQGAIAGLPPSA